MATKFVIFNFGILSLEWPTLLFGMVLFAVVVFFLNLWLLKPVLANHLAKKTYAEGLKEKNLSTHEETGHVEHQIHVALKSQLEELHSLKVEETKKNKALVNAVVEKAQAQARNLNEQKQKTLAVEFESLVKDAEAAAKENAILLLEKIRA